MKRYFMAFAAISVMYLLSTTAGAYVAPPDEPPPPPPPAAQEATADEAVQPNPPVCELAPGERMWRGRGAGANAGPGLRQRVRDRDQDRQQLRQGARLHQGKRGKTDAPGSQQMRGHGRGQGHGQGRRQGLAGSARHMVGAGSGKGLRAQAGEAMQQRPNRRGPQFGMQWSQKGPQARQSIRGNTEMRGRNAGNDGFGGNRQRQRLQRQINHTCRQLQRLERCLRMWEP